MHSLLNRQLKRFFGPNASVPENLRGFADAVDEAYHSFDEDRLTLERSLELSSAELLQANSEMRAVFQAFPDRLFRLDMEGKILDFKGGVADLSLQPSQFLGKRVQDILPPPAGARFEEAIQRVRDTRTLVRIEYEFPGQGGMVVFEARLLPLLEDQIISIVRNITERVRAAQELERSLSLLEATLESTADGILVVDHDGRMVNFNRKFVEMWRIPDEVIDSGGDDRALSFMLDQLRTPEGFLARGHDPYASAEAESSDMIESKDGRVFERYSKRQRVGGEWIGRVWSFRDVTERRRSEEQLAKQRSTLRQVIDLNPNFIFAKNREGRFTLINKAVADAYGTTVEELLGKTDADFNPNAAEIERSRRDDLEVLDTKRDKVIEETITDAEGNLRSLWTIKRAIVGMDGAEQVLGVAMDITERKKLEEQFRQSQKMEAIGLLAGGVAHDFNNLLNVITGYSELASGQVPAEHPIQDHLSKVCAAALRAADLTRKLLAFSRRQILLVRPFDLNHVVEDFTKMLGRIVGEGVEVQIRKLAGSLTVRADAGQIDQVLLNLCTNARQAMPKGGLLVIQTRRLQLDDAFVTANPGSKPGDYAVLTVTDTGTGMSPETVERVFEPFFTTKEKGTGLGLATVYGIVRQHDGFITVQSAVGHGTSFHIYLPLHEDVQERTDPQLPEAPLPGRETILLAEDEPMLRELFARSLSQLGYRVITAENGRQALERFESQKDQIDLVILDAVMPRMSGPEAYRRMKAFSPHLRAVFISGYAPDSMHIEELVQDGGASFLPKPFSVATLASKIREVLDGVSVVSP